MNTTKQFIDAIAGLNLSTQSDSPITIEAVGPRPEIYTNLFPCLVNCHVIYQGIDELGRATSCDQADILFVDIDADPNSALSDYSSVITATPSGFTATKVTKTATIANLQSWVSTVSFF